MRKLKILRRTFTQGDLYIAEYEAPDVYEWNYSKGVPIERLSRPVRLFYKYKTARKTDFVLGEHLFPIVSRRFQRLLAALPDDPLEFHPVELMCQRSGEEDDSYFFMNILENVACFDWERSSYEMFDGDLGPVTNLVLRADKLVNRHLVRMAEIPSVILVSDKLQEQIEAARLLGIAYDELSNFRKY